MRHISSLALIAVLLSSTLVLAKTIYISNDGLDANTGTSETSALKTVAASVSKATTGDSILLRRGDIFRESATFSQTGLIFAAYGDAAKAKPTMCGSVAVTGWTKYQGNIWVASLAQTPEYVFANKEPVWCARYPNSGFVAMDFSFQEGAGYRIRCRNITLSPRDGAGYWTGATMRWRKFTWWWETRKVLTYTTSAGWGEFTIDGGGGRNIGGSQRCGFYFENKFTELDTANEWFYNTTEKKLYLWAPANADPNGMSVEGSFLTQGLTVTGAKVNGIAFLGYKGPALSINGTTLVDRCRFDCIGGEAGGEALRGEAGTINAKVSNSFFRNIFNIGVHIRESATSGSATTIEYDTMQSIGNRPGWGAYRGTWHSSGLNTHYCGIAISSGQNVKVQYNVFDSTGYAAINTLSPYATVQYNVIRHAMSQLNDGAGIYAPTSYSTFRNNIILNTIGELKSSLWNGNISHGIWLEYIHDDHDNTVVNNTIAYNPCHGFWHSWHRNTTVTGNVLYGNGETQMTVDAFEADSTVQQNNKISGNMFYAIADSQRTFSSQSGVPLGTLSGNWYCNPYTERHILYGGNYTIPEWQTAASAIADKTFKTDLIKCPTTPAPGDLTGTSKLLINETGVRASIPVGDGGTYKDLNGNVVTGSVMLDPYSSLIIVHTGVTSIRDNGRRNLLLAGFSITNTPASPLLARFSTTETGVVQMRIFNAHGALVGKVAKACVPGVNLIAWNGGGTSRNRVAPGLYRYELTVPDGGALKGTVMVCR